MPCELSMLEACHSFPEWDSPYLGCGRDPAEAGLVSGGGACSSSLPAPSCRHVSGSSGGCQTPVKLVELVELAWCFANFQRRGTNGLVRDMR